MSNETYRCSDGGGPRPGDYHRARPEHGTGDPRRARQLADPAQAFGSNRAARRPPRGLPPPLLVRQTPAMLQPGANPLTVVVCAGLTR